MNSPDIRIKTGRSIAVVGLLLLALGLIASADLVAWIGATVVLTGLFVVVVGYVEHRSEHKR